MSLGDFLICAEHVCIHYNEESESCCIPEEVDRLYRGHVKCPCYNPHTASYHRDNEWYKDKINAVYWEKYYRFEGDTDILK